MMDGGQLSEMAAIAQAKHEDANAVNMVAGDTRRLAEVVEGLGSLRQHLSLQAVSTETASQSAKQASSKSSSFKLRAIDQPPIPPSLPPSPAVIDRQNVPQPAPANGVAIQDEHQDHAGSSAEAVAPRQPTSVEVHLPTPVPQYQRPVQGRSGSRPESGSSNPLRARTRRCNRGGTTGWNLVIWVPARIAFLSTLFFPFAKGWFVCCWSRSPQSMLQQSW